MLSPFDNFYHNNDFLFHQCLLFIALIRRIDWELYVRKVRRNKNYFLCLYAILKANFVARSFILKIKNDPRNEIAQRRIFYCLSQARRRLTRQRLRSPLEWSTGTGQEYEESKLVPSEPGAICIILRHPLTFNP